SSIPTGSMLVIESQQISLLGKPLISFDPSGRPKRGEGLRRTFFLYRLVTQYAVWMAAHISLVVIPERRIPGTHTSRQMKCGMKSGFVFAECSAPQLRFTPAIGSRRLEIVPIRFIAQHTSRASLRGCGESPGTIRGKATYSPHAS